MNYYGDRKMKKKWKVKWQCGSFALEKRFLFKKNAENFMRKIKAWKRLTKEIKNGSRSL